MAKIEFKSYKLVIILLLFCIVFLIFRRPEIFFLNFSNRKQLTFEQAVSKPPTAKFDRKDVYNQFLKYPIDILLIFTKAHDNFVLQYNLRRSIGSLLKLSSLPVRLHIIIDDKSLPIAKAILKDVLLSIEHDARHVKFVYISAGNMSDYVKPQIELLQKYFTVKSHYYNDFLFFFSIFIYKFLPGVTNVIMMDIDTVFLADIADLYAHFDSFTEDNVIGISNELSPAYYRALITYRKNHPNTKFGQLNSLGGFPGYNSGILLIKVDKLRDSKIFQSYLTSKTLEEKTTKYNFQGYLGDQDLFTLMAFDNPQVFYTLPCAWNRQRCEWYRTSVEEDLFNKYFECSDKIKLVHGNCKSHIPEYSSE